MLERPNLAVSTLPRRTLKMPSGSVGLS